MVYREEKARGVTRLTGSALAAYPVGAVYQSVDPTEPSELFGGTWTRIKGRTLVGVDEVDPDFASAGLAGGEKEHILHRSELAEHVHNPGGLTAAGGPDNAHTHGAGSLVIAGRAAVGSAGGAPKGNTTGASDTQVTGSTGTGTQHSHNVTGLTGGVDLSTGEPHENMPPYYTIYMWRRTA